MVAPRYDLPDSLGHPSVLWIDLWHGRCRDAKEAAAAQPIEAPYTIHAPLANWKKVITKKLGPTQAMISGQLRVKGNLAHILKYVKAAQELVEHVVAEHADGAAAHARHNSRQTLQIDLHFEFGGWAAVERKTPSTADRT